MVRREGRRYAINSEGQRLLQMAEYTGHLQTTAMVAYEALLAPTGLPAPSSLPTRKVAAMLNPRGIC